MKRDPLSKGVKILMIEIYASATENESYLPLFKREVRVCERRDFYKILTHHFPSSLSIGMIG